jgi:uncharacterized protein involved in type VI secretion and phage assembly
MHRPSLLDTAGPGWLSASTLGEVVSVQDPAGLSRVQVRLLSFDGVGDQDGPVWARVAVPFAGSERGAFFIPDVGDEVLVTFVNGDPRWPVVVGSLWNGGAAPPETLGGSGDRVDRWSFVGKAGTRIAIVEAASGHPTISLTTPGGVSATLTDADGGALELTAAGSTITIDTQGVTVDTPATVTVRASRVQVSALQVKVDAPMADFSGIVKCQTLLATTVVASVYTPGAGNVW